MKAFIGQMHESQATTSAIRKLAGITANGFIAERFIRASEEDDLPDINAGRIAGYLYLIRTLTGAWDHHAFRDLIDLALDHRPEAVGDGNGARINLFDFQHLHRLDLRARRAGSAQCAIQAARWRSASAGPWRHASMSASVASIRSAAR